MDATQFAAQATGQILPNTNVEKPTTYRNQLAPVGNRRQPKFDLQDQTHKLIRPENWCAAVQSIWAGLTSAPKNPTIEPSPLQMKCLQGKWLHAGSQSIVHSLRAAIIHAQSARQAIRGKPGTHRLARLRNGHEDLRRRAVRFDGATTILVGVRLRFVVIVSVMLLLLCRLIHFSAPCPRLRIRLVRWARQTRRSLHSEKRGDLAPLQFFANSTFRCYPFDETRFTYWDAMNLRSCFSKCKHCTHLCFPYCACCTQCV